MDQEKQIILISYMLLGMSLLLIIYLAYTQISNFKKIKGLVKNMNMSMDLTNNPLIRG